MSLLQIGSTTLTVTGRLIKIGAIHDEHWLDCDSLLDPEVLIRNMREKETGVDIFTFSQKFHDTTPRYGYYMEWDNAAALPITTFDEWWTKQINDKTRNMVRKAQKKGVEVRVVQFDNGLIEGIAGIYNEVPVRQGRIFWHYGKNSDTIRRENATFMERSDFLAAYYGDELIGFIKLVYTDEVAGMMQILSKIKARDKAPNNALIAKAVEVCAEKGIKYLTYAKFIYGKKGVDPVAEFKNHNGFKKIDFPKYYVPLSIKGGIGLKLKLHRDLVELVPQGFLSYIREVRANWYKRKVKETQPR
jgi:hypothetical protein